MLINEEKIFHALTVSVVPSASAPTFVLLNSQYHVFPTHVGLKIPALLAGSSCQAVSFQASCCISLPGSKLAPVAIDVINFYLTVPVLPSRYYLQQPSRGSSRRAMITWAIQSSGFAGFALLEVISCFTTIQLIRNHIQTSLNGVESISYFPKIESLQPDLM